MPTEKYKASTKQDLNTTEILQWRCLLYNSPKFGTIEGFPFCNFPLHPLPAYFTTSWQFQACSEKDCQLPNLKLNSTDISFPLPLPFSISTFLWFLVVQVTYHKRNYKHELKNYLLIYLTSFKDMGNGPTKYSVSVLLFRFQMFFWNTFHWRLLPHNWGGLKACPQAIKEIQLMADNLLGHCNSILSRYVP